MRFLVSKMTLCLLLTIVIAGISVLYSEEIIQSESLYLGLASKHPLLRDRYLKDNIDKIIRFRGTVIYKENSERYKRKFRLIINEKTADKLRLNLKYYCYIDKKEVFNEFQVNTEYEFTGRIAAYTPLTTVRDSYIIDLVLIGGRFVIE